MTFMTLFLFASGLLQLAVAEECLQGGRLDFTSVSRPSTEDLLYVNPQSNLQHVIAPELTFNCHGYITSWSALTMIDNNESFLKFVTYRITFTVWRPRNDGSNSSYDLIGINHLTFAEQDFTTERLIPIENSTGLAPDRYSYFTFQNKAPLENQNISFQPGDVIGWSVERTTGITGVVSVVYRRKTTQEQDSVNLLSFTHENATTSFPCSVQYCDDIRRETTVLPYLSVNYVTTSEELSSNDVSDCLSRGQKCPVITMATAQPTTTVPSPICGSGGCSTARSGSVHVIYVIIGGTAGGVVVLLCLIISIIAFFICFVKMRRIQKESFQDNPTYESITDYEECISPSQLPMTENDSYRVRPEAIASLNQVQMVENDSYGITNRNNTVPETIVSANQVQPVENVSYGMNTRNNTETETN